MWFLYSPWCSHSPTRALQMAPTTLSIMMMIMMMGQVQLSSSSSVGGIFWGLTSLLLPAELIGDCWGRSSGVGHNIKSDAAPSSCRGSRLIPPPPSGALFCCHQASLLRRPVLRFLVRGALAWHDSSSAHAGCGWPFLCVSMRGRKQPPSPCQSKLQASSLQAPPTIMIPEPYIPVPKTWITDAADASGGGSPGGHHSHARRVPCHPGCPAEGGAVGRPGWGSAGRR